MKNADPHWFEHALEQINKETGGAIGALSFEQIEVAKTAIVAALQATIEAHPKDFLAMLQRHSSHLKDDTPF